MSRDWARAVSRPKLSAASKRARSWARPSSRPSLITRRTASPARDRGASPDRFGQSDPEVRQGLVVAGDVVVDGGHGSCGRFC